MIAIGSDHGGVELKDFLVGFLRTQRYRGRGLSALRATVPSTIRIIGREVSM